MAKNTLPNIQNKQKGRGSTVASIGKKFMGKQGDMSKGGTKPKKQRGKTAGKRGSGRYSVGRPQRASNQSEALNRIVEGSTVTKNNPVIAAGKDNQNYIKKAFDVYTNLANFIKKSVGDLVQKVKTILGVSKEATSVVSTTEAPKTASSPSIEENRESSIAQEKQLETATESVSELGHIRHVLEKMLKLTEKLLEKSGGGGGGTLQTLANTLTVASLLKGGGGKAIAKTLGGRASQLGSIAAKGGLTRLATVRGASKPVTALAKTSDKIVKGVSGAKEKIVETGGKLAGKAGKALGFGTKMGASGAAGAASSVATGAAESAASGAASSVATGAAGSAASGAASSAGGTVAGNAAGQSGGFFSKLLNPLSKFKSSIGKMAPKLLKTITKIPVISTLIEGFFAAKDIQDIKNNPDMSPEEKRKAIGNRIGSGLGGIVGAALGGAALTTLPIPGATIIGAILGDLAGRWIVDTLMESFGGGDTVYKMFSAIPGLGSYIQIDEDSKKQAEAEANASKPFVDTPPPPPPPPGKDFDVVKAEPTSLAQAITPQGNTTPQLMSNAEVTPTTPSASGEAVRQQTQASINADIQQKAITQQSPQASKTEINNYNTNVSGGSGGGVKENSAAMPSSPPDSTMQKMLSGNVGGVST